MKMCLDFVIEYPLRAWLEYRKPILNLRALREFTEYKFHTMNNVCLDPQYESGSGVPPPPGQNGPIPPGGPGDPGGQQQQQQQQQGYQ